MLNVIWTITINEILRLKKSDTKPEVKKLALKIKGDVITYTNAYTRKNVSQEIGRLHLSLFLASHDLAGKRQGNN